MERSVAVTETFFCIAFFEAAVALEISLRTLFFKFDLNLNLKTTSRGLPAGVLVRVTRSQGKSSCETLGIKIAADRNVWLRALAQPISVRYC